MDDGAAVEIRAFVSYSHDGADHRADVLEFTQQLRRAGVAAEVDQYVEVRPPQSWPRWMLHQVRDSEFVLVVCSEAYRRRVEGDEEPGVGRGATWEGALITQELYDTNSSTVKFIPVLMREDDERVVPLFLRGTTRYVIEPQDSNSYEPLLDNLLYRPRVIRAPVGALRADRSVSPAPHASATPDPSDLAEEVSATEANSTSSAPVLRPGEPSTHSEPFQVFDLRTDEARQSMQYTYASDTDSAPIFARVLEVAHEAGAETALVESNYLDIDYRSEWALAYSSFFRAYPSTTNRLHFFASLIKPEDVLDMDRHLAESYLGYSVMRPFPSGRVGRTLLVAPQAMQGAFVEDHVDLFGQMLRVRGFPFTGADRQTGRGPAATAAWMCHYAAVLRGEVARRPVADFTMAAVPALALPQARESEGLALGQVERLLEAFGLRTFRFELGPERTLENNLHMNFGGDRDRMPPLARRALSLLRSALPVLAVADGHIRVLCGYHRGQENPTFISHDDDRGPYWSHEVSAQDAPDNWEVLLAPVPADVRLDPAAAEVTASHVVRAFASRLDADTSPFDEGLLALRTVLASRTDFKSRLATRGVPDAVRHAYQLLPLPRHVWVAEVIDRRLQSEGLPSVTGEVVLDSTSTGRNPEVLAIHYRGGLASQSYELSVPEGTFALYRGHRA